MSILVSFTESSLSRPCSSGESNGIVSFLLIRDRDFASGVICALFWFDNSPTGPNSMMNESMNSIVSRRGARCAHRVGSPRAVPPYLEKNHNLSKSKSTWL